MDAAADGLGELYSADRLAEQLGPDWSRRKLYRLVEEGRLPAVRVGRSVYFWQADVIAWISANRTGGAPVPDPGVSKLCPTTKSETSALTKVSNPTHPALITSPPEA